MREHKEDAARSIIMYVLVCLAAFFLIFLLNQKSVYTADDYMYHFFWEGSRPSAETRVLDRIADIPLSLKNHAERFNGRIISHALVMFFMMHDKVLFNICNSLMYLLLGWLLLIHIERDHRRWRAGYAAVIYLAMWVFLPVTAHTLLWLSGACNYLWMTVLALVFFLPYHLYMSTPSDSEKYQVLKGVLIVPVGLAAGCSSENIGGAVILLTALFAAYWLWKRRKVPFWSITGILSAAVGMMMLLSAPSSRNRMTSGGFQLTVYLKRIREIIGFSYHYILLPLIILLILVFVLIRNRRKEQREWITSLIVPFFYCVAGAASVCALILSPIIMGKSWILAVCFLMIAIGQVYKEIRTDGYDIIKPVKAFLLILTFYSCIRYTCAFYDISRTYEEVQEQIAMIEEQKAQGIMDVKVYLLTPSGNISNVTENTPNVSADCGSWFNQWMACYYGVDSITGMERDTVYE